MSEHFDLVVIGGGPGGYVAAIRAAQLGFKTACIEGRGALGGTCLNIGCIPSKALLHSSELYHQARHKMVEHGIKIKGVDLDLDAMMKHKSKIVKDLTTGIEFLFKKNKVTYIKGWGKIIAPNQIEVTQEATIKVVNAKSILIATGSEVTPLPGIEIDEKRILSSTGILKLDKVPKKLVVIGGGVIGLEMASLWSRLGAEVCIVEFLNHITPGLDLELAKTFQRTLKKQGITFELGHKVVRIEKEDKATGALSIHIEKSAGGGERRLEADTVLVAIGRRPYTQGLGLEALGIALNERNQVKIDESFETNVKGIYAIGDAVRGPMLAHKAEDEGVCIAEILAGQKPHINYDAIPSVIYTNPEVACVGKTEEELKKADIAYKVGKFAFAANARARAIGETEGYVKILADAKSDRVLGAHIMGPSAGELIQEIVAIMEFGGAAEDIARICHAHPTLFEAVKEAALAVDKRQIHA